MQVHVVTSANRAIYGRELEQMHRLRHRLFVEEMGWRDLASGDGLEIDQFDDAHAVYLMVCEDGEVVGSMRLLPTWRRCMLTEVFGDYVQGPSPAGVDVWEWTRYCPGLLSRPRSLVRIRAVLLTATLEFAASRGVERYFAFGETKFLSQLEELGWRPRPHGMPKGFAEGVAMPMGWDVTPDLLASTRRLFGLTAPVVVEAPAYTTDLDGWLEPRRLADLLPPPSPRLRSARVPRPAAPAAELAFLEPHGRA